METQARYKLIGLFTLATMLAGFAFVYWLYNTGGLRNRASYRIEFENSVTGLLVGSAVLFNGMRVGEVSRLELNPGMPKQVIAMIAVAQETPVDSDTTVELEFQGLTGAPVINLVGGSEQRVANDVHPVVLRVEPAASENLTRSAKKVLTRLGAILATNETPLREAVANINSFSAALARNSGRVDGIMSGIEGMTGRMNVAANARIFDLIAPTIKMAEPIAPDRLLVIEEPTVLLAFNTDKILLKQRDNERSTLKDAKWTDNLPNLVQAKVLESFENSGYLGFVSRPRDEEAPSYRLKIDIRRFQISQDEKRTADVQLLVKLVDQSGRMLKGRFFVAENDVKSDEPTAAVTAFNMAFGKTMREMVPWVVEAAAFKSSPN